MSCTTELPLIITNDLIIDSTPIPKFIRLKSLPVSPKYRAKMSNSPFDSNIDSVGDLEVVEFPILTTPPISPAKPNFSPRKSKDMIKFENILTKKTSSYKDPLIQTKNTKSKSNSKNKLKH